MFTRKSFTVTCLTLLVYITFMNNLHRLLPSSKPAEAPVIQDVQTPAEYAAPASMVFTAADEYDSYQELQDRITELENCIEWPDECETLIEYDRLTR